MFEFITANMAKGALEILSKKIEGHSMQLVKLKDIELSRTQQILTGAIETKNLHVMMVDRQGSNDYHISGFLKMLNHVTVNSYNLQALAFVNIYHSILSPSQCIKECFVACEKCL